MHMNRLAGEKSPYLLQHAHNPVDWYPWGQEAFESARRLGKPIFLSVGYSACHWCHVMERESFEDERTAALLNENFVPVKVDREERPDVDRVYMLYVQAATGGGGWPLSVWLTPELVPFHGGTYFPPDNRYGRPGFPQVLQMIAGLWKRDRERVVESSRTVLAELRRQAMQAPAGGLPGAGALGRGFLHLRRSFDPVHGGFGEAPKFPQPSILRFLLREHARTGEREALDMAVQTLEAMARGGIHDHLAGGFHRYSVDERWFLPHFEKMLYDQAQLAAAYVEAFQASGRTPLARVARGIFDYVLAGMTSPEGGFYSAEDADSVIDPARPEAKGEGAFYLWSRGEIEAVLGPEAAAEFCRAYGILEAGNVAQDPHGEFAGKNVLLLAGDGDGAGMGQARQSLLEARRKRVRPHLDDKILTGWNGLMISALALGAQTLEEPAYFAAARRAADFALARLWNADAGSLLRRYRDGDAAVPAFSDDYSFLVHGLIDLYETGFEDRHLTEAVRLARRQLELFEDRERGGLYTSAGEDTTLVMRLKDGHDGAEPSANSVAAMNLFRLAAMTGQEEFRAAGERILAAFSSQMSAAPSSAPMMLAALGLHLAAPKQIVLSGDPASPDMAGMLREVRKRFIPNKVVMLGAPPRWPRLGGATAYVCQNFICLEPATSAGQLAALLE